MKIECSNINYNKNDYVDKFNKELSIKKKSNKFEKDKFEMSYKRPIPISNYDYSLFNFLPKIFKEIFVKDLFMKNANKNKRLFYKYLIGKIISRLYWDDFIYFLILDKNNDIIAVSIFHLEDKFYPLDLEQLEKDYFKMGKYILIINPLFTHEHYDEIMCFDKCEFLLFEYNESLLKFIEMNNNINDEVDLIKIGDLMMEKYNYDKAIYYYEKSIKFIEKKLVYNKDGNTIFLAELILKISLAYLKYGYFSKSLFYADYFYKIFNIKNDFFLNNSIIKKIKLKIFYIKLKSFIKLRKYKEGYQFYIDEKNDIDIQELIKLNKNNIIELIEKISLNRENQKGIFNYKKMLLEEKTNFYLDYGDYISEKISIDFDKEKGLKLMCKRDKFIKKGELIIAEKALVSKKSESFLNNKISIKCQRKEEPFQNLEMTHELMEKVKKYKEDYKIFFILYNGKNKLLNLKERQEFYLNNIEKRIDFVEVKNIIDSSKYSCSRNIFFENNFGVGLWGYTSILNHSCNPNVNNFTIGDFMFCFAIKDILPGEELNSLYFSNSDHYLLRQEKSKINWNFSCSCEFCMRDKNKINDSIKLFYENSMKFFHEIKGNVVNQEKYSNKFLEFEKFLESNKKILDKYEIGNGYLKLIYHYGLLNDFEKSKEISEKMFSELETYNYYPLLLDNLNCLYNFFGYKDKDINNYLLKKYENLILTHSNFKKEDFETLVKLTLNLE